MIFENLRGLYGDNYIQKYSLFNVYQCWNCNNRGGVKPVVIDGNNYLLPECKIADRYMTHVYNDPCSSFQRLRYSDNGE